ncbi:hypothetical protein BJ878DRAFT_186138 [Calycina marina]|uniref:SMP-LTD domain-containing protein n=1 Tax=Calycina marina TaxID=1763456 RepID=A0A9P8CJD1_9HELO|nr:hypothetical protein BJ878DRAFT_186138 [Calycina marina]
MAGLIGLTVVYILGGLTFLPLVVVGILLHGYFTFPNQDTADDSQEAADIIQAGDDVDAIRSAQKSLGEKFQLRNNHEADVAAGYFAVTREYTPGGINAAPPERTTPLGSTTVAPPSQSVYQSMYKSIFDRKPNPSPLDNKGVGKAQRKGGNIFYVVIRHGHLMLYDDEEQLDVRHVVSLAHYNVTIFGGGDQIPEGELFIRRNALCLSRRADVGEITPDGRVSKPFYLFSENCSDKEDFYFALLRNQARETGATNNPPIPLQYDVKDIITLVQRLHSSEEHLQTRWINAIIGRAFLSLYKTPEIEKFVRAKITKKISRVKTPSFLSKIALRNIYMGEAAPVITNPRLKDLTVDGELVVEADVRYTGNLRIEIATTARIDLGARFKAREVELLLAVVLKRIEGHIMARMKPPPSNRFWMTFSTMPKIDMTIEPIVSSRQITYLLILRQIENRIKEVFAESLVFPNWDDSPFHNTEHKRWRGGIWADDEPGTSKDPETAAAEAGDVEEALHTEAEQSEAVEGLPPMEKSHSTPLMDPTPTGSLFSRKGSKVSSNLSSTQKAGTSSSIDTSSIDTGNADKPRAVRSGSFAAISSPIVATDIVNADASKGSGAFEQPYTSSAMASISALSQTDPANHTPAGSPSRSSTAEKHNVLSPALSTKSVTSLEKVLDPNLTPQPISNHRSHDPVIASSSYPLSPTNSTMDFKSETLSVKSFGSVGGDPRRQNSTPASSKSSTAEPKRISLPAVSSAAATAKKWGLNVLQRHADQKADGTTDVKDSPSRPLVMGRGQPLPPPGTPLPLPDRKTPTAPIPVPKRKPIPTASKSQQSLTHGPFSSESHDPKQQIAPPLPKRRNHESHVNENADDALLVVAAPTNDSEPTTPITTTSGPDYMPPWVDDTEEIEEAPKQLLEKQPLEKQPLVKQRPEQQPPRLPRRKLWNRIVSSSPEEDGPRLPSWMSAQEEEARAKTVFMDEDTGV